jgi:hypothetical protein
MSIRPSSEALAPFFDPCGVAVIGASRDPAKVGGSVVANLRAAGFEGRIWPVNPRADVVQGLSTTASLPAVALGAIGLSLLGQLDGRCQAGQLPRGLGPDAADRVVLGQRRALAINDLAAVGMQHLARHVRAVVRREEDVTRGHLGRLAGPAQWDVRAEGRHLPRRE